MPQNRGFGCADIAGYNGVAAPDLRVCVMSSYASKSLLLAASIVITTSSMAKAVVVDFTPLSFSQLSFSSDGLTVTGTAGGAAANVFTSDGTGVGVVGGLNNFTVDRSDIAGVLETITFSFDSGAASGITFGGVGCVGPCSFEIEAFAPGGSSLGTMPNGVDPSLISALFGNVPIASFVVSTPGPHNSRGVGINAIVFTAEDAAAVPLPAALPLFATGAGLMGLLGWRRRRARANAVA
jgi:hypothetical protein